MKVLNATSLVRTSGGTRSVLLFLNKVDTIDPSVKGQNNHDGLTRASEFACHSSLNP